MLIIFLLVVVFLSNCKNPGVRVNLLDDSISKNIVASIPFLTKFIQSFQLKEIDEKISSPIGEINLKVANSYISYNTIRLSQPTPVTFEGNTMTLQDTIVFIVGDGNWAYSTSDGTDSSGSGTFEAELCLDIQQFAIELKHNTSFKTGMSINFPNTQFLIKDFILTINGGPSWFIGFFKHFIENKVEDIIYTLVYSNIQKKVPELIESELEKIINLPVFGGLDLSFYVEDVRFDQGFLTFSTEGVFKHDGVYLNGSAVPFPQPFLKNDMLSFTLSEYTVNSALYLISKLGLIDLIITESMVPQKFQKWIKLSTDWIGWIFIPELQQKFPDKDMQLKVSASPTNYPKIVFTTSDQVLVDMHLDVSFQVILDPKSSKTTDAFIVDTYISLNASVSKLWATQESINMLLQVDNSVNDFSMELIKTQVGQFKVGPLESILKFALPEILQYVNTYLQNHTISIPQKEIPYVTVVEPLVHFGDGFMMVNSNFTVTFPA